MTEDLFPPACGLNQRSLRFNSPSGMAYSQSGIPGGFHKGTAKCRLLVVDTKAGDEGVKKLAAAGLPPRREPQIQGRGLHGQYPVFPRGSVF